MKQSYIILIAFALIALMGCASSNLMLAEDVPKNIEKSSSKVSKQFFVIGNARKKSSLPLLTQMQEHAKSSSVENKYFLFTGNSIKAKKKDSVGMASQLMPQVIAAQQADAKPYFVPGRHEWNFNNTKGLEMMEDFLEAKMPGDELLTPNNGCPLESIDIDENVHLLVIDSEWYLRDWDRLPAINDKCAIKSREKLLSEIEGELKKNANKLIVFAMYHPMFTNGVYGGRFSARDHLFPFQGNIPAPGIASLITEIRSQGAVSIQDRFNRKYNELMTKLRPMLDVGDQRILIVSGHEQNLQYIEQGNIKQLISSAGARTTPVSVSDNGLFSYGRNGYATLDIYEDGSVRASFFASEGDVAAPMFQTEIYPAKEEPDVSGLPTQFSETYTSSVYLPEEVDKTDYFESFWGQHYRAVYGIEVEAKTAVLDTLYGGLEVVRPGGGHQTRSLRLITKDGKEYNMRALRKSAVQFLETTAFKGINGDEYFTNTIPEDVISDFYTAAHPYGAFAIPTLAKAAKVYYTTPELYYVPQQKRLGKYNEDYGNQLYMIVERPTDDFENRRSFGYPDDIKSTDDLLEKLREDEDYKLDEEAYIRARIFDMLVGDWDRHSDQWRWAEFEDGDKKVFVPIPRDRDQVFANFDGKFLNLLRSIMGSINQFGVYGEDIVDLKWFNEAGAKLDRALIKRSDKEVWLTEARNMQARIDKTTIDNAFRALPTEVQDTTMVQIKNKLMLRKDNLVSIVERYYTEFIKFQMLTGTDKDDLFEITRLPNGETRINAFRIKDGEKGKELFDRTFNSKTTEEIWLYGLDDDDVFEIKGKQKKNVLIRIIGGQNKDQYNVAHGSRIKIYDNKSKKNEVLEKGGAHVRMTNFYQANVYDYKRKRSSGGTIQFEVGYNPDYGTVLDLSYVKERFDYILNPYSQRTGLSVNYQFLTQGLDVAMSKSYAAVLGNLNGVINGRYTSRNYTQNFFGIGNETENRDDELSLNYNHANLAMYNGGIGVERATDYGSFFQLKLDVHTVEVKRAIGNFIDTQTSITTEDRDYFLIPNATYVYQNFDDADFPAKGMLFSINGGGIDNINKETFTGFIESKLQFHNSLLSNNRLVLKTSGITYLTFGDTPQFYQQAQLGATSGLRGFRAQRFTGARSLAGTAEISYAFKKLRTFFFPLGIDLYAGYDVGRVWTKNDTSGVWHDAYGGGFMLKWTDALQGNASVFTSEEGAQFQFSFMFSY